MAKNIYSPRTLSDNWFEDREQEPEALSAIRGLHLSAPRALETDLAHLGERYDVLARQSRMPPRATRAFLDDGFNEKLRTSSVDYADPKSRTEFGWGRVAAPPMVNAANAPVCPPEQRPLPGPRSGFGAAVPRHGDDHDRRRFSTTNGDFYGPPVHRHTPRGDPCELAPAGVGTELLELRVAATGRNVGKLTGEALQESQDPASDTRAQRSWLYAQEPALRHVEQHGGSKPPPPVQDNALSLPLGAGAMGKVRADLRERKGRLFRAGATISRRRGEAPGISVFMDDHLMPMTARSSYSEASEVLHS